MTRWMGMSWLCMTFSSLQTIQAKFQTLSICHLYICHSRGRFTCLLKDGSTHTLSTRSCLFIPSHTLHKQAHTLTYTHFQHLHDWANSMLDLADWKVLHNSSRAEWERNSCELNDFTFHWKTLLLLVLGIGNFYIKSLNGPQDDLQVDSGGCHYDNSNKSNSYDSTNSATEQGGHIIKRWY